MDGILRRGRGMVALGGLAVVLVACGGAEGSVGSADCAPSLTFRGHVYLGTNLSGSPAREAAVPVSHMHSIGKGTVPPCRDTNDSHDSAESVQVASIDRYDPDVVIAVATSGLPYVRKGATLPAGLLNAPWLDVSTR